MDHTAVAQRLRVVAALGASCIDISRSARELPDVVRIMHPATISSRPRVVSTARS